MFSVCTLMFSCQPGAASSSRAAPRATRSSTVAMLFLPLAGLQPRCLSDEGKFGVEFVGPLLGLLGSILHRVELVLPVRHGGGVLGFVANRLREDLDRVDHLRLLAVGA